MADENQTLVLVADDEPSTLALVASHMRSKGYRVLEAVDGDQAWELAHEQLPDLVILDVMMPGMSGWEVCRKVREAVSLAHTGVVMLTGIGENLNEMTSPLYGADAYVDKPFEFSVLDEKVGEVLARRRDESARDESNGASSEPPDVPERFEEPETISSGAVRQALAKVLGEEDIPPLSGVDGSAKTKKRPKKKTTRAGAAAKPAKTPAKTAAKKTAAKKTAAKKTAAKKTAAKKTAAKKTAAKKTAAKKTAAKKTAAKKKTAQKKAATKKATRKKKPAPAKKKNVKKRTAAKKRTAPKKKARKARPRRKP